MPGRSFGTEEYRFGFNGKENDNETYGTGNALDFGARIYDSRLGRFLSRDNLSSKYPFISNYTYCANNPLSVIDINGDSLYLLFYVGGDEMFEASALTRAYDIKHSPNFNPARDKVVVFEVNDLYEIKQKVNYTQKVLNRKYGKVVEFGLWSHSGSIHGPLGNEFTSFYPAGPQTDAYQMSVQGWEEINIDWDFDSYCVAGFYGCNTAYDGEKSFVVNLSKLDNFTNVNVLGQPTSSFPSQYTDERNLTGMQAEGDFLPLNYLGNYKEALPELRKTYMVAGNEGFGNAVNAYFDEDVAHKMLRARNGEIINYEYQKGDKDN